jgi:hypothetical protein
MWKTHASEHAKYRIEFLTRLFYSPNSFVTPSIIIHTPDTRITAASTASCQSHRISLSLFFSNQLFAYSAKKLGRITMRGNNNESFDEVIAVRPQ